MSTTSAVPAARSTAPVAPALGSALSTPDNALNAIRFALALLVLISHTSAASGFETPAWVGALGGWSVAGFFVISGYFILGSRLRSNWFSYTLRRAARIYPAYWVQLFAVVLLAAPLAVLFTPSTWSIRAAAEYVWQNASSVSLMWALDGSVFPHFDAWNGSMWTIQYEITAYVLCGLAFSVPIARRYPALIAGLGLAATLLFDLIAEPVLGVTTNHFLRLAHLASYFCAGMLAYALKDRLRARPLVVTVSGVLVVVMFLVPWGDKLAQVPLTMFLLGLGALLPLRAGRRNDFSYGFYLYAFPIQQVVAMSVGEDIGWLGNCLFAAVLTYGASALSWFLVEKPAMQGARKGIAWANSRWWLPLPPAPTRRAAG